MLIRSFLKAFVHQLKSIETRNRRRQRKMSGFQVEYLESRALLAANVTLGGIENANLQYTENDPATQITKSLTVQLTGSPVIDQATVKITSGFTTGQDRLSFQNTALLTGVFDNVTGTLIIAGLASASDYQAALRSVTYFNISDNPNPLVKTITFQADSNPSNTVSRSIIITAVNDPPVVTTDGGTLNYTENLTTPISPNLLVTDPDSTTLTSAAVQITGNYTKFEDRLIFKNTAQITGSWDVNTGKLTLTGIDSVSNYRTALRSVSFFDIRDNPSSLLRTISFSASDGLLGSSVVSRNVNVMPVNDAPQLSNIETTPLSYTQNTPAVNVTSTLLLVDGDSTMLSSAIVKISGNYQNGADVLNFNDTAKIFGSWNAQTGTLTLNGIDSVSNYRTALRSVKFFASNAVPGAFTRTISFQANDGMASGNIVTRDINVTADPFLSGIETTQLNYTVPNATQQITATLQVQAFNGNNLTGAQVSIFNVQAGDSLAAGQIPGITWIWDAGTGILTFTGSAPAADYQTILRTVTYNNPSSDPTSLHREISFQVFEGALPSNIVKRDSNFTSNGLPELSQVEPTPLDYPALSGSVAISSTINVFDANRLFLTGARIQFVPLTGNYRKTQDFLQFVNTATITGVWSPGTGRLVLSGTDTVANYMAALRSVTYFNNAPRVSEGLRTISFQVADGDQLGAPDSNVVTRQIDVHQ